MFKLLTLVLVATTTSLAFAAPNSKLEPRLVSTLDSKGVADILISYQTQTDNVISSFKSVLSSFPTRTARINSIVSSLQAHGRSQQQETQSLLKTLKVPHEVLWITNQIWIREASAKLVSKLINLPEISRIEEDVERILIDPSFGQEAVETFDRPKNQETLNEWGIERVSAPEAWALGQNGTGVIVGVIDTGVYATHVDLAPSFVGTNYGWRDFSSNRSLTPIDTVGFAHGTHCTGSIVGQNGIGVAPGAKFMACRGIGTGGTGPVGQLIACGQFMMCPTLPDGTNPDCSKAPHIVSNSWGALKVATYYNQVLRAWHAAGIIPIFANGNQGPACSTVLTPADSVVPVIAVGSINSTNEVSYFSGRGPTVILGGLKPDITAPGADIRSAWAGADNAYYVSDGTSMATPHVAGVAAILLGANKTLTYDQVYSALTGTAARNVVDTGATCGGIPETQFPNMAYGYGVVNALYALQGLNLTRVN